MKTTLCIVHRHPHVLLGMKKRGFGAGRWNGFGGKVRVGESTEENVSRELREEAGIVVHGLEQAGALNFSFENGMNPIQTDVFCATDFSGEPIETDEMRPRWFHIDDIPFADMWPDDRDWFPLFLEGVMFEGCYHFKDLDIILHSKLVRGGVRGVLH